MPCARPRLPRSHLAIGSDGPAVLTVAQRGLAPVPTPRENSVKTMWFRRSRDAVAAFAAPVLDVPATSSHRPGEASAANPLASRPLSRSRPSPAPNCSGWHSAKRAARTCTRARTARTCRRSLNEVRGNASSNPIHARTALLGSGKIHLRPTGARLTPGTGRGAADPTLKEVSLRDEDRAAAPQLGDLGQVGHARQVTHTFFGVPPPPGRSGSRPPSRIAFSRALLTSTFASRAWQLGASSVLLARGTAAGSGWMAADA